MPPQSCEMPKSKQKFKPRDSLIDTPEAADQRSKLAYNLVVERYISLAHGLPPPPDRCPYLSPDFDKTKGKLSHKIYQKKNHTSTGSTTNTSTVSLSSSVKHKSSFMPHTPAAFLEEDFIQEVEDSLKRRKQQLGLDDGYVLKEVQVNDEDDSHYGIREKHEAHSVLSAPGKKQGETSQGDLPNRLSKSKGKKRKEHSSLSEKDINPNTLSSLDNSKFPNKRSRKTLKDLTNSGEQRSHCESQPPRTGSRTSKEKTPVGQVNPAQDKIAELGQFFVQHKSSEDRKLPKRRNKPPKIKRVENPENPIKDKTAKLIKSCGQHNGEVQHKSSDDSNLPERSGRSPKIKRVENLENPIKDKTAKLRVSSGQHNGEVEAENKTKKTDTAYSKKHTGGQEYIQIPLEISDRIKELMQDTMRSPVTVLKIVQVGEVDLFCLLDSLDSVHIVFQDATSTYTGEVVANRKSGVGKKDHTANKEEKDTETEQSVKMHANREMETDMGKVQPSSSHNSKMNEIDTQQKKEQKTVKKCTTRGKKIDTLTEQTGRKDKPLSRYSPAKTRTKIVEKEKLRKNAKTKLSPNHEVTKPFLEHSALKEAGHIHRQGSEHVCKGVIASRKQSTGSSVSVRATAKNFLPLTLPQQNHTDLVLSKDVSPSKKLCIDPSTETQQRVSCESLYREHEGSSSPTDPLTEMPNSEICSVNPSSSTTELAYQSMERCSERKRKFDFDRSDSEDEDECITTSDEENTILKLKTSIRRKKMSFHMSPGLQRKSKHRKSVTRVEYGEEDDIIIMEVPKTTSENKINYSDGESIRNPKEVQNKSIMSPSPVSLRRQLQGNKDQTEESKRAEDGHQRVLTNSISYIKNLISNSMMKNNQGKMGATPSAATAEVQDEREDLDSEDTLALFQVPPIWQSSSIILTPETTRSDSQGSQLMETGSASPQRHQFTAAAITTSTASSIATTTAVANISATNTIVSRSVRSFWVMDSDEEAEDRESMNMESLFKSTTTFPKKSAMEMNTELPPYSVLGPERWMAATRAMQKKKKNSCLRFLHL